ncbi:MULTISPECIES: Arc family DNA-binding protein [Klebsiella]|uniref:Arc family DNA-binding protein n=1 Tax=Klebsiella TaxID=570 RepID=UPI001CCBCE73|nr:MULTISPECIES: Arc family DNA-binding protein [Klebsiella]MBZ7661059.1 Arc family DNA-binding protein [Klebsiella grimontii]WJD77943.1 Arc family DNA-binding protein [Klebsiella michiganensis]
MTEKDNPNFVERFTVRMPDGMRDAIAERAKRNGRSMNSEIVQILQDALEGGFTLQMDDDFGRVYNQLISPDSYPETQEQFDRNNEMLDWLIDELATKIDRDSAQMRNLLQMRRDANKKNT